MKKTFIYFSIMALMASCNVKQQEEQQITATPVVAAETIQLQTPSKQGGASINEALWNRKSYRDYANEPLTLEELSGVLWAASGINRADGHLTAPSALALYPIQTYAFLESGVYLYDAKTNTLNRKVEGDYRHLATLQDFANTASLNIVYIADMLPYDSQSEMLLERQRILWGMDAAGYAENVNLYAAGHGLKAITRGGAKAEEILKLLQLTPLRYEFVLAQTVGK
jgi:nitroreductase